MHLWAEQQWHSLRRPVLWCASGTCARRWDPSFSSVKWRVCCLPPSEPGNVMVPGRQWCVQQKKQQVPWLKGRSEEGNLDSENRRQLYKETFWFEGSLQKTHVHAPWAISIAALWAWGQRPPPGQHKPVLTGPYPWATQRGKKSQLGHRGPFCFE